MLSIYISILLRRVWYLNFRCPGRTSETLGRGSLYRAEGLSLDFKVGLHFLGRGS